MRARIGIGLLVLAITAPTRSADALSCGYVAPWSSAPTPMQIAPLNTHVWAFGPPAPERSACAPEEPQYCTERVYEFRLRRASRGASEGQDVPIEVVKSQTARQTAFEIVPKQNLEARRRYELWLLDSGEVYPTRLLGTFRTGTAADQQAPKWSGLTHSSWQPPKPVAPGHPRRVVLAWGSPGIPLFGAPAHDGPKPAWIRYAVWTADPGQKVDYESPPTTYVEEYPAPLPPENGPPQTGPLLEIGGSDGCWDSPFVIPKDKKTILVGMRALDIAGNRSAPSELTITLK